MEVGRRDANIEIGHDELISAGATLGRTDGASTSVSKAAIAPAIVSSDFRSKYGSMSQTELRQACTDLRVTLGREKLRIGRELKLRGDPAIRWNEIIEGYQYYIADAPELEEGAGFIEIPASEYGHVYQMHEEWMWLSDASGRLAEQSTRQSNAQAAASSGD